jgi:hypothetical protein
MYSINISQICKIMTSLQAELNFMASSVLRIMHLAYRPKEILQILVVYMLWTRIKGIRVLYFM